MRKNLVFTLVLFLTLFFVYNCQEQEPNSGLDNQDLSSGAEPAKVNWAQAGHAISLKDAESFTSNGTEDFDGVHRFLFSRAILEQALANKEVQGVWFCVGSLKEGVNAGRVTLVGVPSDINGKMMTEDDAVMFQRATTCPPICGNQ